MSECEYCLGEFNDDELYELPVCRDRVCHDCYREHLRECRACYELQQAWEWADWSYDRMRDG